MIPPFDPDGDLPPGVHEAAWLEFKERFCIFARSDRRLRLCQRIEQMVREARAAQVVERIIFGGSFVTSEAEPNDFDCIIVLAPKVRYEDLQPSQLWVADAREASRRYRTDAFVARANQSTLPVYLDFLAVNRDGKRVGLVEVRL
jgi:hypothetical protein